MRQKRNKSNRKIMSLYASGFQFREPYQILVDADFCQLCVQQKVEFVPRLEAVVQGATKPMITQCCMQALYDAGPTGQPGVDLARTFERRKCNHWKAKPPEECIKGIMGDNNYHRYVIATQSKELRSTLRQIPGVPILYINRSVILLEDPSEASLLKKQENERAKQDISPEEREQLSAAVPDLSFPKAQASVSQSSVGIKRKRSGPKGPNPLSVKKKKSNPKQEPEPVAPISKKKRKPRLRKPES